LNFLSFCGIIIKEVKLDLEEQKEARERVLKILSEKKPLGGTPAWEEIHKERTLADANRN
jgi:hypothetical protein